MHFNGCLILADEVRISPFDLGLTVGLGVFETMQSYDGSVFAWGRHYDRLQHSAKVSGIALPSSVSLQSAMAEVITANGLRSGRGRIRVSLGGGVNPLGGGQESGNVIVTAVAMPEPKASVRLMVSPYPFDDHGALAGVKSASFASNVVAYRHAVKQGADEALMLNAHGLLCEGTISNIFIVKSGAVHTPALSCGCLPGVTRAIVLELCDELGISHAEVDLRDSDALDADELFISSSAREVQSAQMMVDQAELVNPVTMRLRDAYQRRVAQELGL